jgi:adenylyltransferase/sulfurtransferase
VLCGRDAVQIRPAAEVQIDLGVLAARLRAVGEVVANDYLVRFRVKGAAELVVFGDGRAIVKGVKDAAEARSVYARYVGT